MMRPPLRNARLLALQLVLLGAALVALATMQYRWIGRVADAERQRRGDDAGGVARRIADDLADELSRLFHAFRGHEDDSVEALYGAWRADPTRPELVEAFFVADRDGDEWSLSRIDAQGRLVAISWPADLTPIQRQLRKLEGRHPGPSWPRPYSSDPPGLFIVQRPGEEEPEPFPPRPRRVIFIRLDTDALTRLLHSLAAEGKGPAYDVAVTANGRTIAAAGEWDGRTAIEASADVPPPGKPEHPPQPTRRRPRTPHWSVAVRHAGGLEALVAAARRRNLALSGAILLILGVSAATLVALNRRGEQLRAQQVAFVSMMTHELNTPVAVIRAAGENLQDGVVADPAQVAVYGRTIVEETERLRAMTSDILALAGSQARSAHHSRERIAVGPLIETVVERCRLLVGAKGIAIDVSIDADIPDVQGDRQALSRAIDNLMLNAIRHGGTGGWVGVRARRDARGVAITVEDRGPGIASADAPHVFEAFYRGSSSTFTDGAGLGLAIVRQIVAEHGGSVTLERREGGAAFTIHLPPAQAHA